MVLVKAVQQLLPFFPSHDVVQEEAAVHLYNILGADSRVRRSDHIGMLIEWLCRVCWLLVMCIQPCAPNVPTGQCFYQGLHINITVSDNAHCQHELPP